MILKTRLRVAAAEDVYYLTTYVAVIFPRFDAAGSKKTNLMSELEFLQLLAELDEEGLVLPDLYTAARIPRLYTAVILRTNLRAAAAGDMYFLTANVAAIFRDSTQLEV